MTNGDAMKDSKSKPSFGLLALSVLSLLLILFVAPRVGTVDGVAVGAPFFHPLIPAPTPGHCVQGTACGVRVDFGPLAIELGLWAVLASFFWFRRRRFPGFPLAIAVLLFALPRMAAADDSLAVRQLFVGSGDETSTSADCAGIRDDRTAYEDCLAFVSEILTLNLREVYDAALEERARLDAEELKSGQGKADRVRRFDSAQKAWEEFFDQECEAVFSHGAPAPDAAAARIRCRNTLLRDRLNAIDGGY